MIAAIFGTILVGMPYLLKKQIGDLYLQRTERASSGTHTRDSRSRRHWMA